MSFAISCQTIMESKIGIHTYSSRFDRKQIAKSIHSLSSPISFSYYHINTVEIPRVYGYYWIASQELLHSSQAITAVCLNMLPLYIVWYRSAGHQPQIQSLQNSKIYERLRFESVVEVISYHILSYFWTDFRTDFHKNKRI